MKSATAALAALAAGPALAHADRAAHMHATDVGVWFALALLAGLAAAYCLRR